MLCGCCLAVEITVLSFELYSGGDLSGVLGGKKNGIKVKGIKKIKITVIMFGMV